MVEHDFPFHIEYFDREKLDLDTEKEHSKTMQHLQIKAIFLCNKDQSSSRGMRLSSEGSF